MKKLLLLIVFVPLSAFARDIEDQPDLSRSDQADTNTFHSVQVNAADPSGLARAATEWITVADLKTLIDEDTFVTAITHTNNLITLTLSDGSTLTAPSFGDLTLDGGDADAVTITHTDSDGDTSVVTLPNYVFNTGPAFAVADTVVLGQNIRTVTIPTNSVAEVGDFVLSDNTAGSFELTHTNSIDGAAQSIQLISADAGNAVTNGTDGALFVPDATTAKELILVPIPANAATVTIPASTLADADDINIIMQGLGGTTEELDWNHLTGTIGTGALTVYLEGRATAAGTHQLRVCYTDIPGM